MHVKYFEQCQTYNECPISARNHYPATQGRKCRLTFLFSLDLSLPMSLHSINSIARMPLKIPSGLPHCLSLRTWQAPPSWHPCFHVSPLQSNLRAASKIIFLKCISDHVTFLFEKTPVASNAYMIKFKLLNIPRFVPTSLKTGQCFDLLFHSSPGMAQEVLLGDKGGTGWEGHPSEWVEGGREGKGQQE